MRAITRNSQTMRSVEQAIDEGVGRGQPVAVTLTIRGQANDFQ